MKSQQKQQTPISENRMAHQSIDDSQGFLGIPKHSNNVMSVSNQIAGNQNSSKYNAIVSVIVCIVLMYFAVSHLLGSQDIIGKTWAKYADKSGLIQQIQKKTTQKTQISDLQTVNVSLAISENTTLTLPYRMGKIHTPDKVQEIPLSPLSMKHLAQAQSFLASPLPPQYLAYTFYQNWKSHSETIDLAEFLQVDGKYKIGQQVIERTICVISPFKNLIANPSSNSLSSYLQSLNYQNYTNFHVYMIDDASTDGSTSYILKLVGQKYARLNNRLTIIRNAKSIGALGNRDIVSRNYCNEDDIIIQVDADDCLIGKQTFKLYNKLYSDDPSIWFLYSNYIMKIVTAKHKPPKIGRNQQIKYQIHSTNTYRTALKYWVTVHLRSYLRKLYIKIPVEYFFQTQTRTYYLWASDRFNMYPLVQLAGPKHTLFIPQILYFYNLPDDAKRLRRNCDVPMIRFQSAISKTQIPLMPLENLDQNIQITKNYNVPDILIENVKDTKSEYQKCIQSRGSD